MEDVEEGGSMSDQTAIGSMPLYTHLERIEKALAALGIGRGDAIRPEQLFAIDQWHYHGTDAIRAAAEALGGVRRPVAREVRRGDLRETR